MRTLRTNLQSVSTAAELPATPLHKPSRGSSLSEFRPRPTLNMMGDAADAKPTFLAQPEEFASFSRDWWQSQLLSKVGPPGPQKDYVRQNKVLGEALTFCDASTEQSYLALKRHLLHTSHLSLLFLALIYGAFFTQWLYMPTALDQTNSVMLLPVAALSVCLQLGWMPSSTVSMAAMAATQFAHLYWLSEVPQGLRTEVFFILRLWLTNTCTGLLADYDWQVNAALVAANCALLALWGWLPGACAFDPSSTTAVMTGSVVTCAGALWLDLRLREQFVRAVAMFETEMSLRRALSNSTRGGAGGGTTMANASLRGDLLGPSRMEMALETLYAIRRDFELRGYSATVTGALATVISSMARSSHKDWAPVWPANNITPPRTPTESTSTLARDVSAGVQSYVQEILGDNEEDAIGLEWPHREDSHPGTPADPPLTPGHNAFMARFPSSTEWSETSSAVLSAQMGTLAEYMRDWNFGEPNQGIWGLLDAPGVVGPRFASSPLTHVAVCAMRSLRCFAALGLDKGVAVRYFLEVESQYKPREVVPYHNALHACDVVQCVFSMLELDPNLKDVLPPYAVFALVFAAAVHDLAHPGLNNAFLQTSSHSLALRYNDRSILENFHVSTAFSIMAEDPALDLLAPLRRPEHKHMFKQLHALIVDIVLGTDLQKHSEQLTRFNQLARFNLASFAGAGGAAVPLSPEDVSLVSAVIVHAADVSNVAKTWRVYKPWIDCLFEEFFAQGDLERSKGWEVTPFMDRSKVNPYEIQSAFIRTFVVPLYDAITFIAPNSCHIAVETMAANLQILDAMVVEPMAQGAPPPQRSALSNEDDNEEWGESQQE